MSKVLHTFKCIKCEKQTQSFFDIMGGIPSEIDCPHCKAKAIKMFGCDFGLRGGGWEKDGYQKGGR